MLLGYSSFHPLSVSGYCYNNTVWTLGSLVSRPRPSLNPLPKVAQVHVVVHMTVMSSEQWVTNLLGILLSILFEKLCRLYRHVCG